MKQFKTLVEEMKRITPALGSNAGGKFYDTDTNTHKYVKHYDDGDQAKTESLTGRIYNMMGIKTLDPQYQVVNGKHSIATDWNDHISTKSPSFYNNVSEKHAHQLAKMFHAAVLTKNWDIVGLEHDNIVHNRQTDDLHAIDHGGAFEFRAMGGHKPYGADIDEHDSLRNPRYPAGKVFNSLEDKHPGVIEKNIEAVKRLTPEKTKPVFKQSGLSNWEQLHDTFNKRRDMLIQKYEGSGTL